MKTFAEAADFPGFWRQVVSDAHARGNVGAEYEAEYEYYERFLDVSKKAA